MRIQTKAAQAWLALGALALATGACSEDGSDPLEQGSDQFGQADLAVLASVPTEFVPADLRFDETVAPHPDPKLRLRRYVERLQYAIRLAVRLVRESGNAEAQGLLDSAIAHYDAGIQAFRDHEFRAGVEQLRLAGHDLLEVRRVLLELEAGEG